MTPKIPDIQYVVIMAFLGAGSLNMGTPFAMASIPVIELQPFAKAWRTRNKATAWSPWKSEEYGAADGSTGRVPWKD